ncbi:MAG: hypothetical protein PWP27_1444 [Clostridiales bacterium]|nr:hypothetical protein [Clostridiales bacterium]
MIDIVQFVTEVAASFVEAILILLLFIYLIQKKEFIKDNKFKTCIFLILYTIFSYWASTYVPTGLHSIILIIFTIVILSFITKSNIYATTVIFAMILIFIIATETGIFIIEMGILKMSMAEIMNTSNIRILHVILGKGVQIGAAILLLRTNITIFKLNVFERENSLSAFMILQVFMMGVFIFSINYVVSHPQNIILYNILLFTIYLLFIILGFLDYKERERILKIQHKFEAQEEYVKNMEVVMDVIRREKHDFANHLNTILAMCILKKPDTIEKIEMYIRKLTNSLKSSYQLFNTGNDYVDGLLAVKSNFAFEHDIHFEVDIEAPLWRAAVNDSHLTSIIGNIIDNAFEAILSGVDREDKVVSICTYIEQGKYCLSISDNGPMIPQEYMEKIYENGFSTKKENKKEHGFGLYIVKQLVERNNGEITVSSSEHETEFLIRFNVRKCSNAESSSDNYQSNTA